MDRVLDDNANDDTYKARLAVAQKAAAERNEQGFNEFAKQVALYHTALINNGFTSEQAFALTKHFQEVFFEVVFGKKA